MDEGITFRMIRDGIAFRIRMIPVRREVRRIMLRLWRRMPPRDAVSLVHEWNRISPRLLTFTEEVVAAEMAKNVRTTAAEVERLNPPEVT